MQRHYLPLEFREELPTTALWSRRDQTLAASQEIAESKLPRYISK
jgi:hypothetical protein